MLVREHHQLRDLLDHLHRLRALLLGRKRELLQLAVYLPAGTAAGTDSTG